MMMCQLIQPVIQEDSTAPEDRIALFRYFGTYARAMITMFEITHVSYAPVARACEPGLGIHFLWFFIIYKCIVAFALLNVIRAMFVSTTLKSMASNPTLMNRA